MLSCVLAIKTILFLGSLNNLKCSERIRLVPPGDQTISAGGAGAAINGSQATGVFGLSVKLKINFISERTGGGGREGGGRVAEWRETTRNIPGSLCPSLP